MNSIIYKYPISVYGGMDVRNGDVVHFGHDPRGEICVWIRHYDGDGSKTKFYLVGTGQILDGDAIVHGSVIDGDFVWHLVEEWNS